QSQRMQELINQMLDLQKLESGMLKPDYTYGEIVQVLRYMFGSFEIWARDKNISMIFSSSLQEVYMDFDQEKMTQIITNLVNNAIKHTPAGGKVAMTLGASLSGDFLLIQISDTGSGIQSEDLPYIFDRFYQSKRAAYGGTGIGLAIVKNLTELLGGHITVESQVNVGSIFKVMLPITKHTPKALETTTSTESPKGERLDEEALFESKEDTPPGKPMLLVVEDHPDVSQYLISILAHEFDVLPARNGQEGLRLSLEYIPDLIISDIMMPGMDGFELCKRLKTDIKTSHIPIILLTGRGDHDALMSGIEHGADVYLVKPFHPEELILRVKKLLELRANLSLHYRQHASLRDVEPVVQASARENEFLKRIRSYVEEHMNDAQFNMDRLSQYMAMSHPQLHRKITALTGESTGKFVRSIRLMKAKDLLRNADMTIAEIAYETGFSDPGYFTKVFTREFNLTPSDYRSSGEK
ncbi:MAG TPA: ATP-binding protein, partial [Saprospiraceae bacterium]|nr:ATP-binding protein [Saprospiraceae bacterium]